MLPERISEHLAKARGYCKVSRLKNSYIFPSQICVDICICENIYTCIMSSFSSDLADWLLVFDDWNVESLFFLIGASSLTLLLNFLVFWATHALFFRFFFIILTVDTTSSANTSFILTWIISFDSSGSKRIPIWFYCKYQNMLYKLFLKTFVLMKVGIFTSFQNGKVSKFGHTFSYLWFHIYHRQNLSSSFIKPRILPLSDREKVFLFLKKSRYAELMSTGPFHFFFTHREEVKI